MKFIFSILFNSLLLLHNRDVLAKEPEEYAQDYLAKMIADEMMSPNIFEIPKKNQEFEEGYKTKNIFDFGTYDFIIVGSGSSGSVVATRLSEIRKWKILLLEAGAEENDLSDIPNMLLYLQWSRMNWGYLSTPQNTSCLGMKDKKCMEPRGKVLGGTSTINAMMYVRGNRHDYDSWATQGNVDWNYDKVLPYFIKSENSEIEDDQGYHGQGGLWTVAYPDPALGTFENFIQANQQLGRQVLDYNGRYQLGVSRTQTSTRFGRRQSLSRAFLDGVRNRNNLKVTIEALVTKIVIEDRVAKGVEFVKDGKRYRANARKEVILSGGTFNSPQLLMLSGIGPSDHLKEMNIDVVADLPVGKCLKEHPVFHGLSYRTNYTVSDNNLGNQVKEYLNGTGPLANPGNSDAVGYIHAGNLPPTVPMMEYIYFPSNSCTPIQSQVYNFDMELETLYQKQINPMTDIMFYLVLLHPKSCGSVTLQSDNPIDFPLIDLNSFSDEKNEDIANLITGIKFILKLAEQEGFRKINATFIDIPICKQFEKFSDKFWECAIRHIATTMYHPSSATPMGVNPRTSVVDSALRVHGIKKLRVVDAGVFPTTISGHTNAPAVMVAEKISDKIKSHYRYSL